MLIRKFSQVTTNMSFETCAKVGNELFTRNQIIAKWASIELNYDGEIIFEMGPWLPSTDTKL